MVRPLKSWISPWKIFRRFEMVGKRVTFDDEQGSLSPHVITVGRD
jgi:hypothetical protein